MRCRSAIPAPPRRFRRTPGWRQRKCIGGIITIIGGTAGTIIIATTITITGAAGKRDNSADIAQARSLRACFRLSGALKLARLPPVISVIWIDERSSS
jgi:hypothetical protein